VSTWASNKPRFRQDKLLAWALLGFIQCDRLHHNENVIKAMCTKMGWQTCGKYRYYLRCRKRDGKIYRDYFGRGLVADLAAQADAIRQAELEAQRKACRAIDSRLDAAERPAADFVGLCRLAMSAVLLAAGFYQQDKHAWRLRSA
jgi:hypothetical protein